MSTQPPKTLRWRDISICHPEFMQWVVQKNGPLEEEFVTEELYEILRREYLGEEGEAMVVGTATSPARSDFRHGPPVHRPERDDAVEVWIKAHRDEYRPGGDIEEWSTLDRLLDAYRLAADTGETWKPAWMQRTIKEQD